MLFLCQLLLNFQGTYALIQVRSLSYLIKAFDLTEENVNYLIDEQYMKNQEYLSEVKKIIVKEETASKEEKKEAKDAYANWIYMTIAHGAPSPRAEKAHHELCIYTRWVDAHHRLHLSTYLKFPTFQMVRIRR